MADESLKGEVLAKIITYGDIHTSSKNYGAHRYYAEESLEYFTTITDIAEKERATHLIGLGDLSFGRYSNLEYRTKIEKVLERQLKITGGNRWELKGNHDSATYGMTEYEFYVEKGLIRPSENLTIGNLNISMIDYGMHNKTDIITPDKESVNIVLAHDFYKFTDTQLPNYGNKAIDLDNMENWFGVDMVICGHIHSYERFSGLMLRGGQNKRVVVTYLGSPSRPAYREGFMSDVGKLARITIFEDLSVDYTELDMPLWDISKSFNLELRLEQESKKENKVDVSDIIKRMENHEKAIGNPEDIIMAMDDMDIRYRNKAVELLKAGNN